MSTIFRKSSVRGHDRYLIYKMLNRKVTFINSLRRPHRTVSGTVKSVRRNIFTNEVEIHVDSRVFRFKEPQAICDINRRVKI